MARLASVCGEPARIALLASSVLLPALASPSAMSQRTPIDRLAVTLTEVERFAGQMLSVTVACPVVGTCTGTVHIAIRGEPYEYGLIVSVPGARLSVLLLPKGAKRGPRLGFGQSETIDVALASDGTGVRDAAMAVLPGEWKYPGFSPTEPRRIPLANIRVTVRREAITEQAR